MPFVRYFPREIRQAVPFGYSHPDALGQDVFLFRDERIARGFCWFSDVVTGDVFRRKVRAPNLRALEVLQAGAEANAQGPAPQGSSSTVAEPVRNRFGSDSEAGCIQFRGNRQRWFLAWCRCRKRSGPAGNRVSQLPRQSTRQQVQGPDSQETPPMTLPTVLVSAHAPHS